MHRKPAKARRSPTNRKVFYTPEPVRGRVVARHIRGQSNRQIAREEGLDRETVGRVLAQPEIKQMITQYRSQLLSMVPKAIDAYDEALDSDDLRLKAAMATKLLEGFQVFGSGEEQANPELDREQRRLLFLGQLTDMMLTKNRRYSTPLPAGYDRLEAELKDKMELPSPQGSTNR